MLTCIGVCGTMQKKKKFCEKLVFGQLTKNFPYDVLPLITILGVAFVLHHVGM